MLLRLLGLVSVERDDGSFAARLPSAQAQVALARLVLDRGSGTSRDCLAETIWPGGVPDTWASAQRSVISRVRRFLHDAGLGGAGVDAVAGRYLVRLPTGTGVDVDEGVGLCRDAEGALTRGEHLVAREAARRACLLLAEPLLPDQEGEWVRQNRARFWEQRLVSLELLSRSSLASRDVSAAIGAAQEAIRLAPFRESAYCYLMDAHAAAGNGAEALVVFENLRTVLADELGIEPSGESSIRYAELLPAARRPRPADPTTAAAVVERRRPGSQRPEQGAGAAAGPRPEARGSADFVGRRRELMELDTAWRAARSAPEHRLVLVSGEPGIGATRLAEEFVARLDLSRAHVLPAHRATAPAGPTGSSRRFHPLVEALVDHVDRLTAAAPADVSAEIPDEVAAALDLARRAPSGDGSVENDALGRLLARALAALARDRPLLVTLENRCVGEGTWSVLHRLLDESADRGLVLCVTGTQPGGPESHLVRSAERAGRLDRIRLTGLSQSDIYRLVSARVADVDLRSRLRTHQLHRDTGGNPFLVGELIRCHLHRRPAAPEDGVSPAVLEYARARRLALSADADRLLQVAALAGESFELDLLAEVSSMPIEVAIDALDALLAQGLVAEQTGSDGRSGHQFCHQLVRRAVVADLNAPRRQRLHARFADVIERRRASELRSYVRQVARHRSLASATAHESTVRSLWLAAQHASADGARSDAARLYHQALDHVPDDDLPLRSQALIELGLAQLAVDRDGATSTLLDAAVTALSAGVADVAVRAAVGMADGSNAPAEEARAVIEAALESLEGSGSESAARGTHPSALQVGRLVVRALRYGLPVPPAAATGEAMAALETELDRLAGERALAERHRLAGELIELAEALGDADRLRVGARHAAASAAILGDDRACRDAVGLLARPGPDGRPDSTVLERLVAVAVREGRFADARNAARLSAEQAGSDRPVQAQLVVDRWLRRVGEVAPACPSGTASAALAEVLAGRRGRPMLAVRAKALGVEPLPGGDAWSHEVGFLSLCAVELADRVAAERLVEVLAPYAGQRCGLGHRTDVGTVAFHLGRLLALLGRNADAERYLMVAGAQLAELGARPWLAVAHQDLAALTASRSVVKPR